MTVVGRCGRTYIAADEVLGFVRHLIELVGGDQALVGVVELP